MSEPQGIRIGPLRLRTGVSGGHVGTLFFVAFFSVPIAGFVGVIQPYVLTEVLTAVANDYPTEPCRARMIAAVFMANGLGLAILPRAFGGLPAWFSERGSEAMAAGRNTFLVVAGVAGLGAARRPRIALAYAAALVSRGDLSVASTFLTLWLVREGVARGLPTADALRQATLIYVIIQASALPWAAVLGYVLDRMDRVVGLVVAMVIAAAGYGSFGLLDDPLGGLLFDHWRPVGPFLLVAGANVVLVAAAALLLAAERLRRPDAVPVVR